MQSQTPHQGVCGTAKRLAKTSHYISRLEDGISVSPDTVAALCGDGVRGFCVLTVRVILRRAENVLEIKK